MKITDTIAAISSAAGNSGIGIIRVSGDEAIEVVDKIFRPANKNKKLANVESHTVHYGHIMDGDKTLDQVLVIVMKNPHSYTGEDTVEIDCHGGMLILKKVLDLVLKNGARTAEPGEFTKRAFLNGRIDLSQAEAVMDLINSKNDFALNSSIEQLKGGVSDAIKDIRKDIIYHIAFIESALDDPEHISLDGYDEEITKMLNENINKISKLVNSFDNGRIMKEGIKTVILGKPNAGKSSLLNLMLGEDRAIVTDIEGTTRDTLEENINFNGLSLKIIDTAGIRDTEDLVERIGVNKAKEIAKEGDLIIYVVDGSRELDDNDREIIKLINDKQAIILVNKSDMDTVINIDELKKDSNRDVILFSAKNGEGMDQLEEEIRNMFYSGKVTYNDQVYITNARHKEALENALESLKQVKNSVDAGMPEDFYSIDLMDAYTDLGLIIGESVEDDLVNEIFSKFCMGK
ncbi:tRNA uridine-5-carboxymethylaminomethyl(34) synthesis GTPase MnmE [Eubacterium ventriosum]|jgi:tRNA modification GTPase|uniref:tRNA modification GTPase MnmE n=2 Tax=root TaxID=1 RepID=A0A415LI91_9FIRM|nr:tRNA uridine-5-carboxymethylaminomethyl(34) synthesis GTPase MnmE [Eubacterium ventriosum]RHA17385.1 tRNA uridine-5-carboxymethylaminomethyl(34) synthesis GTPase MnmE [Eubacterium ventriosum]RHA74059.1 tRNA uridine-5-carboxymethylaminomethyl(34) synthesis GTPase MnmE [Eubacterium ventriosum]RHD11557.1 tRNA uridine-5-carboxymethylaminomethyl(34) synthesis GTPase MnmE [Eubacterium ventriosum]RHL48241.1 tRNA uridine-5-carboxymethylaminomethyl(34) synthesis GTPase MnmE [Eubacterium ventriosum]